MFGGLKKRLKEGIVKLSKKIKTEETIEDIQEAVQKVVEEEGIKEEISLTDEHKEIDKKLEQPEEQKVEDPIEEVEETEQEVEDEVIEEDIAEDFEKKPIEKIEEEKPIEKKKEPKKEKPTRQGILKKVKKALTEKEIKEEDIKDTLWDLQVSLIQSDVALEVAEKITGDLKNNLVGSSVKRGRVEYAVKDSIQKSIDEILDVPKVDLLSKVKEKKPYLIIFLGFNGSGKTTTIARIGKLLKDSGLKVVFAAADTWRAASIEQLEEHGKNLEIPVIKQKYLADPAAVIFDAVKHAESKGIDVVLADTAGRSHANKNLMEELSKITRVNKPDMKILVLDALTGNDVVEQANTFNDAVGVDGLVITKADVYDKGGAVISAVHSIKRPILYVGVGQNYGDLKKFNPEDVVKNLLE